MSHPDPSETLAYYIEKSLAPYRGQVATIDVMVAMIDYLGALVADEFPPHEQPLVRLFLLRQFCYAIGMTYIEGPMGDDVRDN